MSVSVAIAVFVAFVGFGVAVKSRPGTRAVVELGEASVYGAPRAEKGGDGQQISLSIDNIFRQMPHKIATKKLLF